MTLKRALAIALTAAAALPAAAGAQTPIAPPNSDNYLDSYLIKQGQPLVTGDVLGIQVDTTNYTLQDHLYTPAGQPGTDGPAEPRVCEGYTNPSTYGHTVWASFHAKSYGTMEVSAASGNFDEVIRVVPFKGLQNAAAILPGACYDDLAGSQEVARGLVSPGQWYAVQVGGTINGTSPVEGGPMQIKFDLQPPPAINADAVLTWKTPPGGGVKAVKLVVTAPKGSKVTISCTKHGCQAPRAFTVKKAPAFKPIGAVGPVAKAPDKAQVHAAKKFTLLKNKSLKPGSKLIVLVTSPGWIGKYFSWPVTKNGVSAKTVKCTKPGAKTPPKKGGCG
jgi:hypothetical protein